MLLQEKARHKRASKKAAAEAATAAQAAEAAKAAADAEAVAAAEAAAAKEAAAAAEAAAKAAVAPEPDPMEADVAPLTAAQRLHKARMLSSHVVPDESTDAEVD